MSEDERKAGRRKLILMAGGVAGAAVAGWMAGDFSKGTTNPELSSRISSLEAEVAGLREELSKGSSLTEAQTSGLASRISDLEAKVAELRKELTSLSGADTSQFVSRVSTLEAEAAKLREGLTEAKSRIQLLGETEGEMNERVVFRKKELSVINESGVLLNLIATNGGTGIRFFKDFGTEQDAKITNPWSMWIEGVEGYQGLAILRDWRFTSTLWDEDGKLIVGNLNPYPPGNRPANARFQVRGTVDEVQAMVEASKNQTADIFQVVSGSGDEQFTGTKRFTVDSKGNTIIGSPNDPKEIVLYDTANGNAYSLKVTNGRLSLTPK